MTTFGLVVLALLAVSEVLALIPAVASNSIFQLVYNILRSIAPRLRSLFSGEKEESKDAKQKGTKK